jgi:hypothetical protein
MLHYAHCAQIVHRTPERVRLKVRGKDGDEAFFARLATRLAELDGVISVRTNRHAASIVICHDESFSLSSVSAVLVAAGTAPLSLQALAPYRAVRQDRVHAERERDLAAVLLQVAMAMLSGRPLPQLLEFIAEKLMHVVIRSATRDRWAAA